MPVTLEVPEDLFHKIEALRTRPNETPLDVIERILSDYNPLCDGWGKRANEAIQEYHNGDTISESDIMIKYGIK